MESVWRSDFIYCADKVLVALSLSYAFVVIYNVVQTIVATCYKRATAAYSTVNAYLMRQRQPGSELLKQNTGQTNNEVYTIRNCILMLFLFPTTD